MLPDLRFLIATTTPRPLVEAPSTAKSGTRDSQTTQTVKPSRSVCMSLRWPQLAHGLRSRPRLARKEYVRKLS
jgi:hypothetical protein